MKTLHLDISTEGVKFGKEVEEQDREPVVLCINVIKDIILLYGAQRRERGLSEEDRRKFYKLQDVFDKVKEDKATQVELEDDHAGFIRRCFREVNVQPDTLLRRVEEKIREIKDR